MLFSENLLKRIDSKIEVYKFCAKLNQELLLYAKKFLIHQKPEIDKNCHNFIQEIASGGKYLHRGYYCPSRMQELLVDNVKRGKIVKKPTIRTKISHKYYYCNEKLKVVDTYATSDDICTMREYLSYDKDVIYGITCYPDGSIAQLSVEWYYRGNLAAYYVTCCYADGLDGTNYSFLEQYFEKYSYISDMVCDGTIFMLFVNDINSNTKEEIEHCIAKYDYKLKWNPTTNQWVG